MTRSKEEMLEYVKKDAEENGYYVCPDEELLDDLIEGLVENEERYGYASCPCRPASGVKRYDVDIVCPCEYRDADVDEYSMCYCGLFVSEEVKEDPSKMGSIPERRPEEIIDQAMEAREKKKKGELEKEEELRSGSEKEEKGEKEDIPVWRCEVCGYLAARENPPAMCPICKAKSERFERFDLG
ncbi:MAG: ferredoxin-thioredoxin reductase catalytic domain-containing protein [Thermoplasmatota archaeon]